MRIARFLELQAPSKKTVIIAACLISITLALGVLIHIRVKQYLVGYTIAEQESELLELEERLKQLKLERAVRKRPELIEEKASRLLGMKYANE